VWLVTSLVCGVGYKTNPLPHHKQTSKMMTFRLHRPENFDPEDEARFHELVLKCSEVSKVNDRALLFKQAADVDELYRLVQRGPLKHHYLKSDLSTRKERIHERIRELEPEHYKTPLQLSKQEVVNGYHLYDISNENLMEVEEYQELVSLLEEDEPREMSSFQDFLLEGDKHPRYMSFDDFFELYSKHACSDWAKMDELGECFKGFWEYPEGSLERKHAFDLTYDMNARLLYKLPFPKRFLLKTIEIGCDNRQECVRYSNFIGVWVQRKRAQCSNGQ
jgi:hypothetical protein